LTDGYEGWFSLCTNFVTLASHPLSVTQKCREVAFNEVSDLSIVGDAQKELGIKRK